MRKPLGIIAISLSLIVGYNGIFLRTKPTNNFTETINPIPYVAHLETQRQKPHAVFQTPMLPAYNEYCHRNQKLCQFMPRQQLYADILWLGSIQYIGTNPDALDNNGVATVLDSLTTLSPFWNYPYIFGQLIIPLPKTPLQRETASGHYNQSQEKSREEAIRLAKKGEYYLCNEDKIKTIIELSENEFIASNAKFKIQNSKGNTDVLLTGKDVSNPCPSYELPHYMAFNYFTYFGDGEHAAERYRISAFHDDAPSLTPTLAALVYGRAGEHLKSATLRYDRYANLIEQNETEAKRAWGKALFEIQLQLITEASEKHGECGTSYTCLQKAGAIKESTQHSRTELCESGKNQSNIRCILLRDGLQAKLISLNGKLVYPFDPTFSFAWSDEYSSRWALPN